MRRTILIVLLWSLATGALAQSYLKIQIGNATPIFEKTLNTTFPEIGGSSGSYGQGTRTEVGYIQTLSEIIDLEIDVAYLSGNTMRSPKVMSLEVFSSGRTYSWQISPMMRFRFNNNKRLTPYFGLGPIAASGKIYYENSEQYSEYQLNLVTHYTVIKREDSYAFDIGIKSILGLNYSIGRFNCFIEASLINLTVSPDKTKLTDYSQKSSNGDPINYLKDLPDNRVNSVYSKDYNGLGIVQQYPDPYPAYYGSGNERAKYNAPMSSIALNFGVAFKFISGKF